MNHDECNFKVPGKKELKGHEKLQKLKEIYAGSGIQYMPGQYRNITYISRLQVLYRHNTVIIQIIITTIMLYYILIVCASSH